MSPWAQFYEGREGESYRKYVQDRYDVYLQAIADRVGYGHLVMELGAGTGTITSLLADYDSSEARYCATDVCDTMVGITRKRMCALDLDVAVFKLDAIEASGHKPDVVHSHGMLEHFDDDTIRKIIANYEDANFQVHYVPGLYPEPTFGDERLMSVDAWWKICKPVGLSQIITFNDGLDYALVFG